MLLYFMAKMVGKEKGIYRNLDRYQEVKMTLMIAYMGQILIKKLLEQKIS